MKRLFCLLMIAMVFVGCTACSDNVDIESAPDIVWLVEFENQEAIHSGMTKSELITAMGDVVEESESGSIKYDLEDDYYGLAGTIFFGFPDKDRLEYVYYTFIPNVMNSYLGKESDPIGLYVSLKNSMIEKIGDPTTASDHEARWEFESQEISVNLKEAVLLSVDASQRWIPVPVGEE